MSVTIVPTILTDSVTEYEEKYNKVKDLVDKIQLDVIDGVFYPNKTVFPRDIATYEKKVVFEAHLMVDEPIKWIRECKEAGIGRVLGQVERMSDRIAFVAEAQVAGLGVGLAVDLETEVSDLQEVIEGVDAILLMAVKAGRGGLVFDERVLPKIEAVRAMRRDVVIIIDGGLGVEEIKKCLAAEWAQEIKEDRLNEDFLFMEFAVGNSLLKAENVKEKLHKLRHLQE